MLRCNNQWAEDNALWKGDDAGCKAIHKWIRENYPAPPQCEYCGHENRLQLALKNGCEYQRKRENFLYLCARCHTRMDYANGTRRRVFKIKSDPGAYKPTRKQAKQSGDRLYFTGKPCKRGHVAPRWVSSKTCVGCEREKTSAKHHYSAPWPKRDQEAA